jgi:putative transcription antitermination factor YqgF
MEKSIECENSSTVKRYLGVDYGRGHVGLAIADGEIRIAFVYDTLINNKQLLPKLSEIIKKEHITAVIIGIPSHINREEVEYDGERFGDYLRQTEQVAVEYHNEMFSTLMAKENLKAKGAKNIKDLDHQEAARIILQSWLESRRQGL